MVFLFFTVLVLLLRLSTFYVSVINWDESLYLLIAEQWLKGHPPYTVIWDNKPPGIYFVFAIALNLLGSSITSIRAISCIAVILTCYLLYRIGEVLDQKQGKTTGILAGVFYAVLMTNNGGLASNTEIFYLFFVVSAFYGLIAQEKPGGESFPLSNFRWLIIGFLLGIGFQIKYSVVFDLLAMTGLSLVRFTRDRGKQLFISIGFLILGFSLPLLITIAYFLSVNQLESYLYANFVSNQLRITADAPSIALPIQAIGNELYHKWIFWLLSIVLLPLYLLLNKRAEVTERWWLVSILIWLFIDVLCIITVFKVVIYDHYFLQINPALCLSSAYITTMLLSSRRSLDKRMQMLWKWGFAVLLGIVVFHSQTLGFHFLQSAKFAYFNQIKGVKNWGNSTAIVAEYVKQRIQEEDYIYVVDDQPIIYFLAGAKTPGSYAAYPPFLALRQDLPNITGINPIHELEKIMQKQPVYVIKMRDVYKRPFTQYADSTKFFFQKVDSYLAQSYQLEHSIGEIDLYRLRTPN